MDKIIEEEIYIELLTLYKKGMFCLGRSYTPHRIRLHFDTNCNGVNRYKILELFEALKVSFRLKKTLFYHELMTFNQIREVDFFRERQSRVVYREFELRRTKDEI